MNKDINIKGANIEADGNIDLTATNGNMNIASTQDRYYSNTESGGFQVGGTVGFNLGKDYTEDVTNNYTTIKSNNGTTNVATNDLNLVGIQDSTKDNMDLSLVRGTITETQLEESHESSYYDLGISYGLPIAVGGLSKELNNALGDAANALGKSLGSSKNSTISSIGNAISSSKGVQSNITKPNTNNGNTLQPNTDSQSVINVGDWSGSWKNTTVTYKDDNGFDFTASPMSVYESAVVFDTIGYYGNKTANDIGKYLAGKTDNNALSGTITGIATTVGSVAGTVGILSMFFDDSKNRVINKDGEEISATSVKVLNNNGIMTSEEEAIANYLTGKGTEDSGLLYNPTYGLIVDLAESSLQTLSSFNGELSGLMTINRSLAEARYERKDMTDAIDVMHSQSTITNVGASSYYAWKYNTDEDESNKLNSNYKVVDVGVAIDYDNSINALNDIIKGGVNTGNSSIVSYDNNTGNVYINYQYIGNYNTDSDITSKIFETTKDSKLVYNYNTKDPVTNMLTNNTSTKERIANTILILKNMSYHGVVQKNYSQFTNINNYK